MGTALEERQHLSACREATRRRTRNSASACARPLRRPNSSQEPSKVADLKKFFADNDLYLYTANAFVYGVFKKQVIKEDVYEPDWTTPSDAVHQGGGEPPGRLSRGRQTVDPERAARFQAESHRRRRGRGYTDNVIDVVAHLVELEKKTGKTVTLASSRSRSASSRRPTRPSPTSRITCSPPSRGAARVETGLNEADAAGAMRDYMGVVFDIGHQSVGYEDIPASLQKLVANGVPIVKLQEAASM